MAISSTLGRIGTFLSLLGLVSACGGGGSSGGASGVSVTGKVMARSSVSFARANATAADMVAVPGATCTISGTDNSATSDAEGKFTLSDVQPGSYILICKKQASDGSIFAFLKPFEVSSSGKTLDLGTLEVVATGSIKGQAVLAGATNHADIAVSLRGTSFAARTDKEGHYEITGVPPGTYDVSFEKTGFKTKETDGVVVSAGQATALDAVVLMLSHGVSGAIVIDNGAPYTSDELLHVTVVHSDDAVQMQLSDRSDFLNCQWEPVDESRTWQVEQDATVTLYVKFADANGLPSSPASASIIVDTTPPEAGMFTIVGTCGCAGTSLCQNLGSCVSWGSAAIGNTSSREVTFHLGVYDGGSGVAEMKVAEGTESASPDFDAIAWMPMPALDENGTTGNIPFTLSAGDGAKTLYAIFRDRLGYVSSTPAWSTIVLDTTPPAAPGKARLVDTFGTDVAGGFFSPLPRWNMTNMLTLHFDPSADTNAWWYFTSEDPAPSSDDEVQSVYSGGMIAVSSGDGEKHVYLFAVDTAGNVSPAVELSLTVDGTPPTAPQLGAPSSTTVHTGSIQVPLATATFDVNFDHYETAILGVSTGTDVVCDTEMTPWTRNDPIAGSGSAPGFTYSFASSYAASYGLCARALDKAGNASPSATPVIVDYAPPQ